MDEITIQELKKIRDYFGVNDASLFNQMAFTTMDKHIKALDNLTSSSRIIWRCSENLINDQNVQTFTKGNLYEQCQESPEMTLINNRGYKTHITKWKSHFNAI